MPTPGELLARVASGDRHAFPPLYEALAPRVFGLVRAVLRDAAQAEEVTQEVFVELWRTAARFDENRGSAIGWVCTLAHRRAVDRVRSSQSSRDRDLTIGRRDFEVEYDSVAEAIEISQEHSRVMAALQRLTPLQRDAIVRIYLDGSTAAETAEALGVPVGTVKTRMRDGLIRLRGELAA